MLVGIENIFAEFRCKQTSMKNIIVFYEATVSTSLFLKKYCS